MELDWGVASLPLNGQSESGDRYVVQFFPGGVLLGVIDGLGHGDEAAAAARTAESILRAQPQEPVISLVRQCHESLRSTRGVVMSVVSFEMSHRTAQVILSRFAKGNDDALVLVARIGGNRQ